MTSITRNGMKSRRRREGQRAPNDLAKTSLCQKTSGWHIHFFEAIFFSQKAHTVV